MRDAADLLPARRHWSCRHDRRLLMPATRLPLTLVSAALAVNALLPEPRLWFIHAATALTGLLAGLGGPAMMAAIPALVGTERLASAGALTSASAQFAALLGPAVGGLLVAGPGLAACPAPVETRVPVEQHDVARYGSWPDAFCAKR
ncbi:MFS transporter [Streptomyces sp. ActVer]|uniref:MFS transporter n=1 Tax=Streptomyces sp. ActVer TaxID=3014558 RepID=UPI0022B5B07D|nr:MFS transporter [Streptomyces sp. ActVer]MCZ4509064.1 MFS transporter [Streptomyces sp. ActVer]